MSYAGKTIAHKMGVFFFRDHRTRELGSAGVVLSEMPNTND